MYHLPFRSVLQRTKPEKEKQRIEYENEWKGAGCLKYGVKFMYAMPAFALS